MILQVLNTLNIALEASVWLFLVYLLRRDQSRYSRKRIRTFYIILVFALLVFYQLWESIAGTSLVAMNQFTLVALIPTILPAFFIYLAQKYKNLFFITLGALVLSIGKGLGNLSDQYLALSEEMTRLINLILSAVLLTLLLAGLVWFVRYRFPALYEAEESPLWKDLWIIILALCMMQVALGTVYQPDLFRPVHIIPARLFSLMTTTVLLYMAGSVHKQAQAMAQLERETELINSMTANKDRQFTRIIEQMENSRRLRHDMRQINTVISNLNKPNTREEMIQFCEETLRNLEHEEGDFI